MRDPRNHPRRHLVLGMLAASCMTILPGAGASAEESAERLLVFGDSQAQGLAGGVIRRFRSDRERRVLDKSKISTGLTSRSTYDWPAAARTLAAGEHADVAFALFGANDRPTIRVNGQVNSGLLQRFTDAYGAKVDEVAAAFQRAAVPLVWVGHPIVKDVAYAEDMELLNEIYADHAEANGAVFLSTWDTFKGPDGGFSPYGRGLDGQTTRLRADDGVHMTPAGYDVITALLLPFVERYRRSARPSVPATSSGSGPVKS